MFLNVAALAKILVFVHIFLGSVAQACAAHNKYVYLDKDLSSFSFVIPSNYGTFHLAFSITVPDVSSFLGLYQENCTTNPSFLLRIP